MCTRTVVKNPSIDCTLLTSTNTSVSALVVIIFRLQTARRQQLYLTHSYHFRFVKRPRTTQYYTLCTSVYLLCWYASHIEKVEHQANGIIHHIPAAVAAGVPDQIYGGNSMWCGDTLFKLWHCAIINTSLSNYDYTRCGAVLQQEADRPTGHPSAYMPTVSKQINTHVIV